MTTTEEAAELQATVRDVLDTNRYLVLGTTQPDGTFGPDGLSGDVPLRVYRLTARTHEIHVRGSDPVRGQGVDTRLRVPMP